MSTTTALSIAERLRQERLRLGWTQADLAQRAELSALTCRRFERTGVITFPRFVALVNALGLTLQLAAAEGAAVVPAPTHVRQRGRRHPSPPKPTPRPTDDTPSTQPPAVSPRQSPRKSTAPAADSGAIAAITKEHRDTIMYLVRTIVFGGATNYTAYGPVRNTMDAKHIADDARPAFVGAVTEQLNQLNADNCAALRIDVPHFNDWAATWRPELGIVGALD